MAKALGKHPQLIAWQIDNGIAGHNTASSFNEESRRDWIAWLKAKYETVERLNAFVVNDCVPDITFVLDVDAATAASRMQKPRKADRMEQQSAEFYERVREAYHELAKGEPNRIVLIDGSRNSDEIESEIWNMLCSRFSALTTNPQS